MTYSFLTKKGTASAVTIPVSADTTGATLTVEFSYRSDFRTIVTTKPATATGGNVVFSLTAAEVDSLKDARYRIKHVKSGKTNYIQSGVVDYIEPPAGSTAGIVGDDGKIKSELLPAQTPSVTLDDASTLVSSIIPLWVADYDVPAVNRTSPTPPWNTAQYAKAAGVDVLSSISVVEANAVPGAATDRYRPTGRAMKVEVRPGDTGYDGGTPRAEVYGRNPATFGGTLSADYPDPVGSERWYGFSIFVPNTFTPATDTRWLVVTQLKGVTGGSPPLNLEINRSNWRLGGTRTNSLLIPNSGILGPITKGKWTHFVYGVKLATDNTGWVEVWMNGVLVRPRINVSTMDTRAGADTVDPIYFKQGIYRDPAWTDTTTFHFGPAKVGSTKASVIDPHVSNAVANHSHDTVLGLSAATNAGVANAALIQAAVDAAGLAGGGTVKIPVGTWVTAPLKLRSRVRLVGFGFGSQLKLANASNSHLISLFDVNTEQTTIQDIWLDGNSANQSAGNWDVVNLDNTGYVNSGVFPSLGDPNHLMSRVSIVNGKRNGVYLAGSYSQSQFDKVLVSDCDNNSFAIWAPDCHFINCVSRRSGKDGFGIYGNSERLLNCKSFLSGRLLATAGSGFIVSGVNEADLTHCEAQDNRQHGFSLNTTTTTSLVACRADRNGLGPEPVTTGWGGDGIYVFNVTDSRLDLIATDRNADGRKQRWAYNCSTGNARNIVTLVCGTNSDASQAGVGSFGATSVGYVRWNGTNAAGAFA